MATNAKKADGKKNATASSGLLNSVLSLFGLSKSTRSPSKTAAEHNEAQKARKLRKAAAENNSLAWTLISWTVIALFFANVAVLAPIFLPELNLTAAPGAVEQKLDDLNDATIAKVQAFLQQNGKVETHKGKTMLENVTKQRRNLSHLYWQFNAQISQYALYTMETTNNGQMVEDLVAAMATSPIVTLESMGKLGSEWKMFGTLKNDLKVIFKPARMKREETVDSNLYYFSEKERHFGEIAAFHLDRILGFNRVPPCVGRTLNITSDMLPNIDDQFVLTIHRSPNNNLCFYGQCMYLCDLFHPICGNPDTVEFSACTLIPNEVWRMSNIISPWRRSYMVKNHKVAEWEMRKNNDSFCENYVLNDTRYNTGRRLLDLIDLHLFDFLTGNQDRHSYFVYRTHENDSSMIVFDNGRGFGRPKLDDTSILAPLFHCCRIRQSTYEKFLFLAENKAGVRLSSLVRRSLAKDPLSKNGPILAEPHLEALDRRVQIIIETINKDCVEKKDLKLADVIVNDGF